MANDKEKKPTSDAIPPGSTKVKWDDSNLKTSYANVVNVSSTREELNVFFGTNQTWNVGQGQELTILLNNRIILSPFAAKRLWLLLGGVLKEYESRFGALNVEARENPENA